MSIPQRVRRLIAVLGSASVLAAGGAHAAEPTTQQPESAQAQVSAAASPSLIEATPSQKPPIDIELTADSQGFDLLANRFVAVGNVKVILAGGRLLADRIEYESATRTIYASGRIRFQRGNQYLQASKLRYSLIENSGEIDEVYGVLDLDSAALDLNPSEPPSAALLPLSYWSSPAAPFNANISFTAEALPAPDSAVAAQLISRPLSDGTSAAAIPAGSPEPVPSDDWQMPPVALSPAAQTMACPPALPPVPNWRPYPWAATVWGGQMIDANFGDTFLFNGELRPEYLWGVGLNKRLLRAGPLAL